MALKITPDSAGAVKLLVGIRAGQPHLNVHAEVLKRFQVGGCREVLGDALLKRRVQHRTSGCPTPVSGFNLNLPILTAQHKRQTGRARVVETKETGCSQKARQDGGLLEDVREVDTPHRQ